MLREAAAEIDLDAIASNLGVVRRATEGRPVIAVVKADAYGHGAVEVSKRLLREGVPMLAVAFTGEAVQLRDAGIRVPILVLFDDDAATVIEYDLIPVIHDLEGARRVSEEAGRRGRPITVHIKVDTGMGRLGFQGKDIVDGILAVANMDHIVVGGLMSHFSDSDVADRSSADAQLKLFSTAREALRRAVDTAQGSLLCHMANSAATLLMKDAHMDAVRPGLVLYGYASTAHVRDEQLADRTHHPRYDLRPAMKVSTKVLSIRRLPSGSSISYGGTFITRRESLIAVLAVGYADGYNRMLSNNADILVRGKRAPVVGRVCMDLTMIDVTEIGGVKKGDEAVLLGKQGNEEVTASEIAMKAGTIPYEILTALGSKSRRVYKECS